MRTRSRLALLAAGALSVLGLAVSPSAHASPTSTAVRAPHCITAMHQRWCPTTHPLGFQRVGTAQTYYYIEMAYNNVWVVNNTNGLYTYGNPQQLWHNGNTNESYDLLADGNQGLYQIEWYGSTLCLNDRNHAVGTGSVVQLWPCSVNNAENIWTPLVNSSGTAELWQNASSNGCMDDHNNVHANGNPIDVWTCNGGPQQYWIGP